MRPSNRRPCIADGPPVVAARLLRMTRVARINHPGTMFPMLWGVSWGDPWRPCGKAHGCGSKRPLEQGTAPMAAKA